MKRIVIVDDDPAILDAFSRMLQNAGYEVTVYANGQPLLADDFPLPDLLILDKQLSGADGLDICRYLKHRERTKELPVIVLSASPHIQILAMQAGANGFLEKPFRYRDLLNLLERHLP
ncbi:response regulator [Paraflavitalea sp. CAU 1676]|uniref:response regulator n=1 Tax=Paraflavitalea sp. CAU 1676 TaxID=3032598 RepID=UPI0023DC0803|nr:response regulator [Paraflavitalea sp. CAU 1676]MDF2191207.1 response regulator [Paraflavitalea sp. CAU 1676]